MGTAKLRYRSKGEIFSKTDKCLCAELKNKMIVWGGERNEKV